MSAASNEHRSPREIEADLERNRDRIGDRIEQLESRLAPGELFEQAWRFANKKRADGTTSRLQDVVVKNPLPVTLIGLGLAWMALSGSDGSVPRETRKKSVEDTRPNRASTPASAADTARKPAVAATHQTGTPPPAPSARSATPPVATKPTW